MRGAHLALTENDIRGPIQFDEAFVGAPLASADAEAINGALLDFFNEVFDKTGYARPENLHGLSYGADTAEWPKSPNRARMVNTRHTGRVKALLDDAKQRGAAALTGARR